MSVELLLTPVCPRLGEYSLAFAFPATQRAGLKIKLNAVALKGFNETEIPELSRFALGRGMDLTVIKTMPIGEFEEDRTDHCLTCSKLRSDLERQFALADIPRKTGGRQKTMLSFTPRSTKPSPASRRATTSSSIGPITARLPRAI